ncbi:MAG TPA: PAS domain S-box protein [Hyphomicrobiaceae bacterium]|jgi:PAS domain S-box-containing protein|nr:PAS domain S-box protein [Hyphomicrobiaceae bacterium]
MQAELRAPAGTAPAPSWLAAAGLVAAVAVGYYLAARLSLHLLTTPEGVAAFWPAGGLAAGAIVALGRAARVPVAIGVMAATILANLAGARDVPAAIIFAMCNAGEALLIAWLIERYHGAHFNLESLPRVLGFFLATAAATAVSGIGGAAGIALFNGSGASVPTTWLHWFASDTLGVVAVAPLVIGIARSARDHPKLSELLEGACILAVLVLASVLGFGRPTDQWFTILPFAMVLPLLIWPAARCPPVFAAAAVFILALVIVVTLTFGVGRLGDASVPLSNRLPAAQAALLTISTCTLVVAALFAERRSRESLLRGSNARLGCQEEAFRRLLGSLPAAIYTTDRAGRLTYCNEAAVDLWGRRPELGKDRWFDLWRLHYPDGTSMPLDDRPTQIVLNEGRAVRGREALLERPDGSLVPIMPCPAPLVDERGAVIGVVNMQVDLTERKEAEAALAERDTVLTLASKVARVGSYTLDCVTGVMRLSPGCAALYGMPEGTEEVSSDNCRANVHPHDLPGLDALFAEACREQQRELVAQFRIIRAGDGVVRWIETRNLISYSAGRPLRIVGIGIDVTERKKVEADLKESESRLADALAAGQVIAFEWDAVACRSQRSANAARILGYGDVDGVGGPRCYNFFSQVHRDDRRRFKVRIRALRPDNPSYALSFRFRSPDGRLLWLEETAKGEFDAAGRLLRIKGLTRNITDRKTAELALAERNMQLSLAGKAALVGSFSLDFEREEIQVSEGYAALHGLPEGTRHTTLNVWQAGVHSEDLVKVEELRNRALREQRREYGTEYRVILSTGEVRWIEARCFFSYAGDGRPERMVGVNIDVTERKRAEEHQRMLLAELDHRVKNVLATVSAVASRTQDANLSGADFAAALAGRIRSMAATHELLSCRQWKGVSIRELVRRELAPYTTGNNTDLDGPEMTLRPEAAQAVSMVLHELTTNAAKYGALATEDGRVSVRWSRALTRNPDARVCIAWRETDGPTVRSPERSGYGTEVIRDLIPYELGGAVDLAFAPGGVRCDIEIPVAQLLGERPSYHRADTARSNAA